jgi:hypothetical protein
LPSSNPQGGKGLPPKPPHYDMLKIPGGESLILEGCGIVNRGPEQVILAAVRPPQGADDLEPRSVVAITRHQAQALVQQERLHGVNPDV